MSIPAVEARSLTLRVGGRALVDAIDLALRDGEVLAVVGPNGAGKSTLLGLMAGDLRPDDGEVLLRGRPLRRLGARERARERAVMQQHTGLRFGFAAREVVAMGRHPHLGRLRGLRPADHAIIDAALAHVDASHLATRSVPSLSGGESARVHLARVLAQTTSILMLDEPAAALDVRHQAMLMKILRARAADGAACMIVVHDLNLAARHADRIALVADGRLRAVGDPWAVLTPSRIAEAFGHPAEVIAHPACGRPLVLPLV